MTLSVITPARNARETIARAIESVRRASVSVEHIVVDGCSDDDTAAIVRSYPDVILISEPDESPHHAMNKGIGRASGGIIGFLNADDRYEPGALEAAAGLFDARPDAEIVVGGTRVMRRNRDGAETEAVRRMHDDDAGQNPLELSLGAPGFNGRLFRRGLFDRIGMFDASFFLSADREFLIRCALAGVRSAHLGCLSYTYLAHAQSRTMNGDRETSMAIAREHCRLAEHFLNRDIPDIGWRSALGQLFAYESAKLAVDAASRGRLLRSVALMASSTIRQPGWIFRAPAARRWRRRHLAD